MIDKIVDKIPSKAKWFDLIEISGENTPVVFKNNRFYSLNEKENHGFGIRVNIDNKTGFSHTNDREAIDSVLKNAIDFSKYGDEEHYSLPGNPNISFEPYDDRIDKFDINSEIENCHRIIKEISCEYPGINININVNHSKGFQRLINSSGVDASYKNSFYSFSLSLTYILKNGSKIDIGDSYSSLFPERNEIIITKLLKKLEYALTEKKADSGKIPVIFTPSAFARLCGVVVSGLNGKSVYKGISPFTDKLNSKVFNEKITMIDNPLISDSPYSFPFDDEGVEAREKYLIENGVIKTFINDLRYSEKLNIEPTGNGSRGYSTLPSPSFSSVSVNIGDTALDDLISDIKYGLIAEQFIGFGQSNTLSGEFSSGLDLAFLIENGKITGRVKDSMISGNVFDMFKNDMIISKENEKTGSAVMPYVCFPEVNFTG